MDIFGLMHRVSDSLEPPFDYSLDFHIEIESHLPSLIKNSTEVTVTNFEAAKYNGDFYGYLDYKRLPKDTHYIIQLVNKFTSPSSFNSQTKSILIPSLESIEMIKTIFNSYEKPLY